EQVTRKSVTRPGSGFIKAACRAWSRHARHSRGNCRRVTSGAEEFPPRRQCLDPRSCLPAGVIIPVAGRQEGIDDKTSNVVAQPLTTRKVEEEMYPGKDPAPRCFLGSSREAGERAFRSRQNLRSDSELEMVSVEEGNQHLRPGCADDRMSARVGGVRGRV